MSTKENVLLNIPLVNIITEGQMIRQMMDDDHVVELSMSITQHGLLEPIVVSPLEDGTYQLLAGRHRLAAFYRLRRDTIPAVTHDRGETPIKALAAVENICRRDLTLEEEIDAVIHLHDTEKNSPSQIMALLGKSRDWVLKRLAVPNMQEDVRDELLDGRISLQHAETITQVGADNLRAILINAVIQQKLTVRQTKDLADLYINSPTLEDAIEKGLQKAQEVYTPQKPTRTCEACGRTRDLNKIRFVPICAEGCEPAPEHTSEEDQKK